MAVVAADDPDGPVYLLQVTPSALKGLNAYHKELSMRGIPAEIVKTKIGFDTDASYPKLKFGFAGFLDEDAYAAVEPLFGADNVLDITGERQPEVASTETKPRKAAVKAEPKAEPEPEPVAEPVAEEKPKRGFGAAKAEAPKAAAKPKAEPKAAAEADDVLSLADEIASLVGDDDDD